jgi:DNA-binding NarL/FixJ family response regulator
MIKLNQDTSPAGLLEKLAYREREVFELIVKGLRTKEISTLLDIKPNTVSTIKKVIYRKLKVTTNIELYKIAQECNLV